MYGITIISILEILMSFGIYKTFSKQDTKSLICANFNILRYGDITKEQLNELIKNNRDIILLDVRTLEEHMEKNIPNSILIPLNELGQRTNELNKNKIYVIYCRSGVRSKSAFSILKSEGFEKLYNLLGGINEYYK